MKRYQIQIKETIISTYDIILEDGIDPSHAFYEMPEEEQELFHTSGDCIEWKFHNVVEIPYIEEGI